MSRNFWMISVSTASVIALATAAALATPPPANTVIGNQAAATYESNGETFTVQSNLVETIVNEVFGVDLQASQTRDGAPGGFVFFPHAITNNGNTDDVFDLLSIAAGGTDDFPLTNIEIFPDADQDGVPDSLTPISVTPAILAGETFGIVVRATVPSTATATEVTDFDVTATSQGDPLNTVTVTDIVDITTDGIIDVQKDQSLAIDANGDGVFSIGDTVEVTLTYSNTGIAAATGLVLTDNLPIANANGDAITLTYTAGSAFWSDFPGTALTEASGNTEATNAQGTALQFEYDGTSLVTANLDTVPAGRSGEITFRYVITDAPDGVFENIANVLTDTQPQTPSNTSPVSVAPSVILTIADAEGTGPTPGGGVDNNTNLDGANPSTTDDDGATDDTITDTDDAFTGSSVPFDLVLTNLGNGTDTFTIDVANTDFPAGTTFSLVAADGVTPLVGNEVTLPSGSVVHVQVIAHFPSGATAVAGPAGFDAVITATSQADPSITNTANLLFDGALLSPPVDLEDTDGAGTVVGGTGNGATDNGGAAWVTTAGDPGETIVFPMRVSVDAGAPANTFDLAASTDPTFATLALPAGWVVEFFDANGVQITNTGSLIPTAGAPAVFEYEARVTIPAGSTPGDQDIYFEIDSPVNGASDTILNAVTVNEIVDLQIEADTTVQAAPGGVAVIAHTITNLGNSDVTAGALTLGGVDPFTDQGMTAALFYDANGDGVLDAGDPVITDISDITGPGGAGLQPGETARVFVRAQVPATASFGLVETGDLAIAGTVTTASGAVADSDTSNNSVLDTISIISGDVTVTKEQAVDTDCDGTADTAFAPTGQNADPGQCLSYRLTADNTGTSDATNVIFNDTTPAYTSLETCAANACAPTLTIDGVAQGSAGVAPADEATGLVSTTAVPGTGFTLVPGSRAVLTFTVEIDS